MDLSLKNVTVGFVGGGNMAKAMGERLLREGVVERDRFVVSAPSESTLAHWKTLGVRATHSNRQVVQEADVVFLAFKPHQLDSALQGMFITDKSGSDKLFVSVLAGVTNEVLHSKLCSVTNTNEVRLIRAIPNTASLLGEGFTGIALHRSATEGDLNLVKKIFSCLGKFEVIPENLIGAVGSLAGSGIAYIYMVIEALSDAGVKQGLPRALSTAAAAQTLIGAAKMVSETGKHPGQLKDEVCSPGGTTICGVHALEKAGMRAAFIDAIEAGVVRAKEIGKLAAENLEKK